MVKSKEKASSSIISPDALKRDIKAKPVIYDNQSVPRRADVTVTVADLFMQPVRSLYWQLKVPAI